MSSWSTLRALSLPGADDLEAMLPLVTLKSHLRIGDDDDDEDADLLSMRAAAVGHLEGLGVVTVAHEWQIARSIFAGSMVIPLGPVVTVDAIAYEDSAGNEQTVEPAAYRAALYCDPVTIRAVAGWPKAGLSDDAVRIRFTAGYAPAAVPPDLVLAIALLVAHWFEHREAVTLGVSARTTPFGVAALIAPYRRGQVA